MHTLPSPRGAISETLLAELVSEPHALAPLATVPGGDVLSDEDLQLSLYLCYELHYRGLPTVDERWEWEPSLLALRRELEASFEGALRDAVPFSDDVPPAADIDLALREIADEDEGPSLSTYIRSSASNEQVREFMIHRSAYQLKEADPHSWAIPRLSGSPKAALIEVQMDEYGRGRLHWMHSEMFARAMAAVGLDQTYGAYLEQIPAVTLATVNLMSLFGLHRLWRGAIVGHLALFEMSSSIPNARYADGLRRLGYGEDATAFFDEHVVADAVHENIATVDLAGGLARLEPDTAPALLWGARTLVHLDRRWVNHVLGCWEGGKSSLRAAAPARMELV